MYLHTSEPSCRPLKALTLVLFLLLGLSLIAVSSAGCGDDEETQATETTGAAETETTATEISADKPAEEEAGAEYPVTVTDDIDTSVTVEEQPERIVSTAPANTEILFALGAGDRVVGVTSLADYPPEVEEIEKIGDFQANTEAVTALDPDVVIGYSGNEEALTPIRETGTPIVILNPTSLDDVYENIALIGAVVGRPDRAAALVEEIRAEIEEVSSAAQAAGESPRVFYALDNTLWTPGSGSFVDDLLGLAAAENVAADGPSPYFQYTPEELVAEDPEIVLLPGSVFQDAEEFAEDSRFQTITAVEQGRIQVIEDVLVTRPGPRIPEGLRILVRAIYPDAQ